jgi:sialic acid synthase
MTITAIIPARGGSKRIPKKNIKMYCDKPLLVHSIEQAKQSKLIDRIVVSTDDNEIAEIAKKSGAEIIMRPKHLAEDHSTDYDFMKHFLDNNSQTIHMLVHLRPTYPNRDVNVIDNCINTLLMHNWYDSLRTVIPNEFKTPYKMYKINNDEKILEPLLNGGNNPDQTLPQTYIHNGYVDCVWPKTILEQNSVSGTKIYPYVLDKKEIDDIDILEDFVNSSRKYRERNKKVINLGGKLIGEDYPCFFIAEAGINHNGEMKYAKQLIDMAHRCGADCVKFQKRTIKRILTKEGLERPYTGARSFGPTYGQHKEFLEMSFNQFKEMKEYADNLGILFTASGWDEESVDFLYDLGVPFFKMASADLTNFPLLVHTAKKGLPIIISTGMADMETVVKAYDIVSKYNNDIIILQCTSTYPALPDDIHLNVIQTYKKRFPNAVIGYSGHENGLAISLGAVALGAKVVERHFTLDRTMKGGDHAASLEEPGFQRLVRDIHILERARGGYEKKMWECEKPCFLKLSKSLVSTCKISKGTVITREMLTTKGPGRGISPMRMEEIIGKVIQEDIDEDIILVDKMF